MFSIFRPSQFYLVLDVANLTQQEISLNYANDKSILIEPKESCRVPIPVERCPLDQILAEYHQKLLLTSKSFLKTQFMILPFSFLPPDDTCYCSSGPFNVSEIDLPEKLCAEHIASLVNLKYLLASSETSGVATLRGISLSSTMLDLVTVSPIHWDVRINQKSIAPQSEITVSCGANVTIEINISNNQNQTLQNLILSAQFYQDYQVRNKFILNLQPITFQYKNQNGSQNYRLETRLCSSGPN